MQSRVLAVPIVVLAAAVAAAGFVWGVQADRAGWWPGPALAQVARWLGGEQPPAERGRWSLGDGRRPWVDWQAEMDARLQAIGYVEGSQAPSREVGVVVDTGRAAPGLNLVSSSHHPQVELMDLGGNVVHRWRLDPDALFPHAKGPDWLHRARLLPDGSLLALFPNRGVVRVDRDSTVRWTWADRAHHDLQIDEQGRIWVLSLSLRARPDLDATQDVVDDEVVVLDADTGQELRRFALYDALVASPYGPLLRDRPHRGDGDYLHTNTLRVLDGRFAGISDAFKAGNLLLSMRNTSLVLVVDPETVQVVWAWRGPWFQQHEPTLVEPGHLLLFDNMGAWPRSRVLELDLRTQGIVRALDGGSEPLVSACCSTAARLTAGNTLAVASDTGRAVEFGPDGEVVWAWNSPARAGDQGQFVATLFQLDRLDAAALGVMADLLPEQGP